MMEENQAIVEQIAPKAVAVFEAVYSDLKPLEQITIQANAERQGAAAWRSMLDTYPQVADELESLAKTEEASADFLDEFLINQG